MTEQKNWESLIENEGFQELNPEPVYYNLIGAEPLMGIALSVGSFQKKGEKAQSHYDILVMRNFMNGGRIDKETGDYADPEEIEAGEIVRIGEKAQVKQYLGPLVGKAAMLYIVPLEKVKTSRGNQCWTFKFYARALSKEERKEAIERGLKFDDLK